MAVSTGLQTDPISPPAGSRLMSITTLVAVTLLVVLAIPSQPATHQTMASRPAVATNVPVPPQPSSSVPITWTSAATGLAWAHPRPSEQITRDKIARAQHDLARLGHDPGRADGVVGPKTTKAVRAFQAEHGLEPDGMLTSDLVHVLQAAR
jgi:Putative peptidoglycan binding domain